jgi:hypothetical protein
MDQVDEMCELIIREQQSYPKQRIAACSTLDLRKLKETVYPRDVSGCCITQDPQLDPAALPRTAAAGMRRSSPALGSDFPGLLLEFDLYCILC